MEGCAQFKATADDLRLTHGDQRSNNSNTSLFSSSADDLVERLIISRSAIRIPRTVLFDCTNLDFFRAQYFRPAHCDREKMRIAKGNVGDWDVLPNSMRFGHRNFVVRQSRPTDDT